MTNRKPPQLTAHNASAFSLDDVVANYRYRTPYPTGLAPALAALMRPPGGAILELGCGPGNITRAMTPYASRIDAVDVSAPMIEVARASCTSERVRWLVGPAETMPFEGPYALAISGDALGWMDWDVVLDRVRDTLAEDAMLALVQSGRVRTPWDPGLFDLIAAYSVMRDFEPYDFVTLLKERELFEERGRTKVGPEAYARSIVEFIDGLHATAGLPRERMGHWREFDAKVATLLEPFADEGLLQLESEAEIVWGRPG